MNWLARPGVSQGLVLKLLSRSWHGSLLLVAGSVKPAWCSAREALDKDKVILIHIILLPIDAGFLLPYD